MLNPLENQHESHLPFICIHLASMHQKNENEYNIFLNMHTVLLEIFAALVAMQYLYFNSEIIRTPMCSECCKPQKC